MHECRSQVSKNVCNQRVRKRMHKQRGLQNGFSRFSTALCLPSVVDAALPLHQHWSGDRGVGVFLPFVKALIDFMVHITGPSESSEQR